MDILNKKKVKFLCTALEQRRQDFILMESKLLSEVEDLRLEVNNLQTEINYLKQGSKSIRWKPYLEEIAQQKFKNKQ
jgi:cell division protein FtsB